MYGVVRGQESLSEIYLSKYIPGIGHNLQEHVRLVKFNLKKLL